MSQDDPAQSQPAWSPSGFQVRFDRLQDPNEARPTTLLVSHPATPFVRHAPSEPDESQLQEMAFDYLNELRAFIEVAETRDRLGLPDAFDVPDGLDQGILDPVMGWPIDWLPSLDTAEENSSFRWAPFNPTIPEEGLVSLTSSIDARRHEGEQHETRTIILLASDVDSGKFLGSDFGLYVVAHIDATDDGFQTRVTGMRAVSPSGRFLSKPEPLDGTPEPGLFTIDELIGQLNLEVERRLQLQGLTFRKARLFSDSVEKGKNRFELRGSGGSRVSFGRPTPFEFIVEGIREKEGFRITRIRKSRLVVNASDKAKLFHHDPMSSQINPDESDRKRRPTRDEETLKAYRSEQGPFPAKLVDPQGAFRIEPSEFVKADEADVSADEAKSVQLPGGELPATRTNDFAAVSAYYNTEQFFERMRRYGIAPGAMFKKATLPLHVYYRSGAAHGPGKDGQTVNAEVRAREPSDPPRTIEVHLMLANLSHRTRGSDQAEPLGIAADSRWMLHEFGHVLLLAATGEKEFAFAHSCGDALAAIAGDPHSRLAERQVETDPEPELGNRRGVTFPWTHLTRRHDRCVRNGWAWGGTLDPLSRHPIGAGVGDIKAYQAEQILSTSLFRLYRCLGGDTVKSDGSQDPDRDARETAAHYTIYLIMQAIRFLALPAPNVGQFVNELIDADVGTSNPFKVPLESETDSRARMGGCARKLIRWAFEAQGLYQAEEGKINNAPGMPEAVDIYIADNRPLSERTEAGTVTYETPGYVPVSLDWASNGPNPPAWHAKDEAIQLDGVELKVTVNNRGQATAEQVSVRVWYLPVSLDDPASLNDVTWNDSAFAWTERRDAGDPLQHVPPQDVPPDNDVTFGPFEALPGSGDYLVFAEATCASDRANSDQNALAPTLLPCSTEPTRIVDLVAGDNNLGLRIIQVP